MIHFPDPRWQSTNEQMRELLRKEPAKPPRLTAPLEEQTLTAAQEARYEEQMKEG